jgi:hypothetical protein
MPKKKDSKKNRKVLPKAEELIPEVIEDYKKQHPNVSKSKIREIIDKFYAYYGMYGPRRNAIQDDLNTPARPVELNRYIYALTDPSIEDERPARPLGHPYIQEEAPPAGHPNLYEPMFKSITPGKIKEYVFGYDSK